ncbi:MAG: hypothetical protein KIT60_16335 [Burkholderiaceae bacterium]|nr:hypothetical protein [Burkholderiaceae bacterium]
MRTMHRWWAALLAAGCCGACWGQNVPPREGGIYVCIDDQGRVITRDRYIAECRHKEQRVLNRDGSLRSVLPPTLTAEERARIEAGVRAEREAQAAQQDVIKYDRLLKTRYPNEAAHQRAREAALAASRSAIQSAETRLRELAVERKRLADEAEFYRGRVVPIGLRQQIDGNEGQAEAQRTSIRNVQGEQERINRRFDTELARLRKLWEGAEPGSLGPPPQ